MRHKKISLAQLYEVGPLHLRDQSLKTVKALVNQNHLRHNAVIIKKQCSPATLFCAVVKANAYGHGAKSIVASLPPEYADAFAVSSIEEAEEIYPFVRKRKILVTAPVFSGINPQLIQLAQARGFNCTICTMDSLKYVREHLHHQLPNLPVHLKLDTGMGRIGCRLSDIQELLATIRETRSIILAGVYTHLATADNDLQYASEQLEQFNTFLNSHPLLNQKHIIKHTCNTSALLQLPHAHYDMVRCGIGLYGYANVVEQTSLTLALKPILRVETPVVQVKQLQAGESCGYNQSYIAAHDMVIGIVSVGYADGLMRCLSNCGSMRFNDQWVPIIGQVSMDLTIVDLSSIREPYEGMTLTVIDNEPGSPCSVQALSRQANTIPYEIFTGIGNRIKRELVE
ncbi:MAG: alanine racemase [Phycisphaerae bacterium]|nr:alanine racemase [Phycisphaerae bacterium]